jgi:hypothetical protein
MSATIPGDPQPEERSWTVALRRRAVAALPPEKLLPDGQPTYVASWIYVFGVLTLSSLAVVIGSGTILALKGPGWWHDNGLGHFFNSFHLWSVELLFFFMVIHLARRASACVDERGGHLSDRRPVRVHRLPVPAELRRAVDLDPG